MEPTPNAVIREQRILSCANQVKLLARRAAYKTPGNLYPDLLSVAWIGAIEAVDRFNPNMGVKLSTFTGRRITGSILDYLRRQDLLTRGQRKRVKTGEDMDLLQVELHDKLELSDHRQPFDRVNAAVSVESIRRKAHLSHRQSNFVRLTCKDFDSREIQKQLRTTTPSVCWIRKRAMDKMRAVVGR